MFDGLCTVRKIKSKWDKLCQRKCLANPLPHPKTKNFWNNFVSKTEIILERILKIISNRNSIELLLFWFFKNNINSIVPENFQKAGFVFLKLKEDLKKVWLQRPDLFGLFRIGAADDFRKSGFESEEIGFIPFVWNSRQQNRKDQSKRIQNPVRNEVSTHA